MGVLASVFTSVFTHKSWPYPRKQTDVIAVVVTSLVILGICFLGAVVFVKYDQQKTLHREDIRLSANELKSYLAEVYLLATKTQQQPLTRTYRSVYFEQLQENIDTLSTDIEQHNVEGSIQDDSDQIVAVSDELSDILSSFIKNPDDSNLYSEAQHLRQLQDEIQDVGDSL